MKITGKIWKYGDDVNTDYIFPGVYTYMTLTEEEMGKHAMEGLDPDFTQNAAPGDIIVAGKNWGCGSSREQAVKCLRARGIAALVASSVARINFRNSINEGFPVIICPEAVRTTEPDDTITIDFDRGVVSNRSGDYSFAPYNAQIQAIMNCGGLIPYIKESLKQRGKLRQA